MILLDELQFVKTISDNSVYDLRLNTYDLPSGTYFLKINDAENNFTVRKFVKE